MISDRTALVVSGAILHFDNLWQNLGPLTITGLTQGAIIALFALGYTLVYGVLRLINFAHSEVFLVGTYAAVLVWGVFGLNVNSSAPGVLAMIGLLIVGLVIAMAASGVAAVGLELIAYRPLRRRNAPPLTFLITAIGASLAISEIFGVITHRKPAGVPPIMVQKTLFSIGGAEVTNVRLLIIVGGAAEHGGAGLLHQPVAAGPGYPGGGPEPGQCRADGCEQEPGHLAGVRARRHDGRRRGYRVRPADRYDGLQRGHNPGHRGLRGRRGWVVSATCAARCSAVCCSACWRTTPPASSVRRGSMRRRSCCWC